MTVNPARTFDDPVARILFFKAAFIADPFFYFAPFVFAGGNAKHFIAAVPERDFAGTFGTLALRTTRGF